MRKKRIDGALASIPVQNGQVLKGEHLAILREVLSAAINENKYDIDRIISADPDAIHVYGEDSNALDEYTASNEVLDGVLGYVHTPYEVEMYEYNEGINSWEYLGELSLVELFKRMQLLELEVDVVSIPASDVPFNGSGTNYLVNKLDVESAIKELDSLITDDADVDLNVMAYFNYAGSVYGAKYSLLPSAWESSLVVDPLEISANSISTNPRGTAQYLNGETEGVIIPQGMTTIGENAFRGWLSNNQPLVIPNSITSIGGSAFRNWASNNQPLVIPSSVTSIGSHAFGQWLANNQLLVIPSSVENIEGYSFKDWSSNNQPLVIPEGITSIGGYAFDYWLLVPYVEIKSITPPTLTNANAFSNQNDAPIYVPDESVAAYKAATNWVLLADRIFSINDK